MMLYSDITVLLYGFKKIDSLKTVNNV